MVPGVQSSPNYNAEAGVSKFNSWAMELIALDVLRRNAHNEFVQLDIAPERILVAFSCINEIYRVIRPMMQEEVQKKFDARRNVLREDCLAFFNDITNRKKNDVYAVISLDQNLWKKIDIFFTDIYTARDLVGLGYRRKEKTASPEEFAARMVREL